MTKSQDKGELAFDRYYLKFFKSEAEYLAAKKAWARKIPPVLFIPKRFVDNVKKGFEAQGLTFTPLVWMPQAIHWPKEVPLGSVLPGYLEHWLYPMDEASLITATAVKVEPHMRVVDACAAPGGKALVLLDQLDHAYQLLANDLAKERGKRLKRTLADYGYGGVNCSYRPAERLGLYHPLEFDLALADVPCSSEAHVLASPKHLSQWSQKRTESLHKRQVAIIDALIKTLKPGGKLIYGTCAFSPWENEGVIEEILNKYPELKLLPWDRTEVPGNDSAMHRTEPLKDNCGLSFTAVLAKA